MGRSAVIQRRLRMSPSHLEWKNRCEIVRRSALPLLIICFACNSSSSSHATGRPGRELVGSVLTLGVSLDGPTAIAVHGHYLLVGEGSSGRVRVLDKQTGRQITEAGRTGDGPGEFRSIWSIQPRVESSGTAIWIFDTKLLRATGYWLRSDSLVLRDPPIRLLVSGVPLSVQWLDDSTIIAAGLFAEGRFYLTDAGGRRAYAVGTIPYVAEGMPVLTAQQILQPSLGVHPHGHSVAIGARYAGRIDLYRIDSGSHVMADAPEAFDPAGGAGFRQGGATRFGYISVAVTPQKVFGLFSGRRRAETPGRANYGQSLHVFDWNGRLLDTYSLDRDVFSITADPEREVVYAIVEDPEPAIVAFSLAARE